MKGGSRGRWIGGKERLKSRDSKIGGDPRKGAREKAAPGEREIRSSREEKRRFRGSPG